MKTLTDMVIFHSMVAQSQAMKEIFSTIKKLSSFQSSVLITGESGTGKELVAKALHQTSSSKSAPFVAVNCGAIPENLIESELFGHEKGAFTDAIKEKKGLFEEASGGTLFLDEMGELSLTLQVKLLRAIQEQKIRRVGGEKDFPIKTRIIAATHKNLEKAIINKTFREDLYYRLNVVNIKIPPLRERPEDIEVIANALLKKISNKTFHPRTIHALQSYNWPGNVRELQNILERLVVFSDEQEILPTSLPKEIFSEKFIDTTNTTIVLKDSSSNNNQECFSIKQQTLALEIRLIKKALEYTKGNKTHAAKLLEISHRALLYKIKEFNL